MFSESFWLAVLRQVAGLWFHLLVHSSCQDGSVRDCRGIYGSTPAMAFVKALKSVIVICLRDQALRMSPLVEQEPRIRFSFKDETSKF